ncbi:fumarylacetoacetate hydrolase family protein [Paenibacillus alkalitolerans]|uniref:fumarylacetoacetate hydrolase family protein n=1 Tax=Paenibacillus alkalitolerans TaxID=2799335 RepID=UPI0018F56C94|nr:fumarylacetoacetate hydrolase family protein [Paenibacillus alkalitolerans]
MRLATVKHNGIEKAAIAAPHGLVLLETVNESERMKWKAGIYELLVNGQLEDLSGWYRCGGEEKLLRLQAIALEDAEYAPLYRTPRKIWGIGMNYVDDPVELADMAPDEEPVSFMKPDTSLIGPGDPIMLPSESERVTAEAELAVIIGKTCRNISEDDAPGAVAGYAAALDMTAADIHGRNARYLTRSKSFDTFFSLGAELVTADEVDRVTDLTVTTSLNGTVAGSGKVSHMKFSPWFLISFHSHVMTLLPGDIILTGTPGAVVIRDGDRVDCLIDGFRQLSNPVTG